MDLHSFSDLHQTINHNGDVGVLLSDVKDAGSIIFYLVMRVAIWAILNAILLVGFDMVMKTGNIKGREEVKVKVTRVFWVIIFLLNVCGIAGCTLQIGADMF